MSIHLNPLTLEYMSNEMQINALGALSMCDMVSLRATSKKMKMVTAFVLRSRAREQTARFFKRVEDFLNLLDTCSAVVAGSVALQVVDPNESYVPSDLDIITIESCSASLIEHLNHDHGYIEISKGWGSHRHNASFAGVRVLERKDDSGCTMKITVTVMKGSTPCEFLRHCQSSLGMNIFNGNFVLSCYARETGKRVMLLRKDGELERHVRKYNARGYGVSEPGSLDADPNSASCPSITRSVGDEHCFIMSFTAAPYQDDPVFKASAFTYFSSLRGELLGVPCWNQQCRHDSIQPLIARVESRVIGELCSIFTNPV
jgi:hypothetical protein